MIDIEKLVQEFVFLREKLRETAACMTRDENIEASFIIGSLHSVCHNHVMSLTPLVPPKQAEEPKNDVV